MGKNNEEKVPEGKSYKLASHSRQYVATEVTLWAARRRCNSCETYSSTPAKSPPMNRGGVGLMVAWGAWTVTIAVSAYAVRLLNYRKARPRVASTVLRKVSCMR